MMFELVMRNSILVSLGSMGFRVLVLATNLLLSARAIVENVGLRLWQYRLNTARSVLKQSRVIVIHLEFHSTKQAL